MFSGEHANERIGTRKDSGDEISQVIATFGPVSYLLFTSTISFFLSLSFPLKWNDRKCNNAITAGSS